MEKGKQFVQNLIKGKTSMSSQEALLRDIQDIVFQGKAEEKQKEHGQNSDENFRDTGGNKELDSNRE